MVKYYVWFANEVPSKIEECWSYETWNNAHSEAAEAFLDYAYDNCDGWEWMPKDNGKTIIRVMHDNHHKDFYFALEFSPEFTAYEVEA